MRIKKKSSGPKEGSTKHIKDGKIVVVPIDSVHLWKGNPRKNDQAVKKLAAILEKHGQITAVIVWNKNRVIYKGNTTYKALKLNGSKYIKVMLVDFPSETAATAYGIADNRASEFSYWDDAVLESLMSTGKLDYQELGFTNKEFRAVTLLPDLDVINQKADHKELLPLNTITIKCETDVLDNLKSKVEELVAEYEGKAVIV